MANSTVGNSTTLPLADATHCPDRVRGRSPGGRAPAAQAGCGGVQAAGSKRNLAKGPEPLAIGDSVMLLAVNPLARAGFNVNAQRLPPVERGARDPQAQEAPAPPARGSS